MNCLRITYPYTCEEYRVARLLYLLYLLLLLPTSAIHLEEYRVARLLYLLYLPTSTYFYLLLLLPTYLDRHVARSPDQTQLFAQESPEKSAKEVAFPSISPLFVAIHLGGVRLDCEPLAAPYPRPPDLRHTWRPPTPLCGGCPGRAPKGRYSVNTLGITTNYEEIL